jgi:hypothetical protein
MTTQPQPKLAPCVWKLGSTNKDRHVSEQPAFCKKAGCDGTLTEGIMRGCKRYMSEDDDRIREAIWRSR